jgi:hypothetical protein
MGKKLGIMTIVLVVLGAIAAYLAIYGHSVPQNTNPLENVATEKISKIGIKNFLGSIELEKGPDGWNVTSPVHDVAEPSVPGEILGSLKNFSVGSRISENPAKYSQFDIDDAHATRFQVFTEGKPAPALDGFVGKPASDYQSCYFRFAASTPVYVVSGIPQELLNRDVKSFRLMKVLPVMSVDVTAIEIHQQKSNWELIKSSNNWTARATGAVVDAAKIQPILNKLQNLTASDFGNGDEKPQTLGLAKPFMTVRVEAKGKPASLTVGGKAPPILPGPIAARYAKTDGREAIMIVREDTLTDLLSSLKNPKK